MADGRVSYPSVFVVDGGTGFPPPLPPKPGQSRIRTLRTNLIQKLLLVLVCLALCGLLVEGCFIYQLHRANQTSQAVSKSPSMLSITSPSVSYFLVSFAFRNCFSTRPYLLSLSLSWLSASAIYLSFFLSLIRGVVLNWSEALSVLRAGPRRITHESWIK